MYSSGPHGWMWVLWVLILLFALYADSAIDLPRGWLPRLGARRAEARVKLLDEAYRYALREFGNKGYDFWKTWIRQGPITFPHPDDARVEVQICPTWDDVSEKRARGRIRVLVS